MNFFSFIPKQCQQLWMIFYTGTWTNAKCASVTSINSYFLSHSCVNTTFSKITFSKITFCKITFFLFQLKNETFSAVISTESIVNIFIVCFRHIIVQNLPSSSKEINMSCTLSIVVRRIDKLILVRDGHLIADFWVGVEDSMHWFLYVHLFFLTYNIFAWFVTNKTTYFCSSVQLSFE